MSPQMATDGVGLMIVSGPQSEYDAVRAELDGMTGEVWYVGERPDLAAAYKLFGNCMLFAISAGLADVIAMARANDIDPIDALSLFSKFLPTNIINVRGPRMARGEVTPASFARGDGAQGRRPDDDRREGTSRWSRCPASPGGWTR